jgi:hypothetical protein
MVKVNPDTSCPDAPELDELDRLSNSVVDLIDDGRLDDAERACRELKRRYPDMIDWIERTGSLHEARGEVSQAIEFYRKCIGYIDSHPVGFDAASKDWY